VISNSLYTKIAISALLLLSIFSLHNGFVNVGYEGGWTLYAREMSGGARLYDEN
jgi:hypothetical protein